MADETDEEINVLRVCFIGLRRLPWAAQSRILNFLMERFSAEERRRADVEMEVLRGPPERT